MCFPQGFRAAPHGEISPPDGLPPTPDRSPESASPASVFPLREPASLPWAVAAPRRRRRLAALGCALCLHLAAACALAFLPDTPPRPLPAGYVMEVGLASLSGGKTGGSGGRGGNTGETAGAAAHTPQRPARHAEQASGPPRPAASSPERRPAPRKPRFVPRMSAHAAPHPAGSDAPGDVAVRPAGSGGGATPGSGGPGGPGTDPVPGGGGRINPLPPYPELARQRGQEGESVLLVSVDAQGHALEARIQRSSGHALLDRSALDTVRRWTFSPATRDGRPVPGQVVVPVRFRLR